MKKWIHASTDFTNSDLISLLKAKGIDVTKHRYELYAEEYERYSSGGRYKKKFTCPGDYLAYFSMCIHTTPNADAIDDYFGRRDFEECLSEHPTVSDMKKYASYYWWGDGSDYIFYLKNLDTNEYLYESTEDEEDYEEDEWED